MEAKNTPKYSQSSILLPLSQIPPPNKVGGGGRGEREKGEGNSQKADLAKYDHGTKRVDKASSLVSLRAAVRRCCKKVGGVTKRNSPPPSQCQSYKTCSQRVFWMIKVYSCGDWINTWNRNSLRATGYTETAFHRGNAPNSKQPEAGRTTSHVLALVLPFLWWALFITENKLLASWTTGHVAIFLFLCKERASNQVQEKMHAFNSKCLKSNIGIEGLQHEQSGQGPCETTTK